jgi:hypothetical protein
VARRPAIRLYLFRDDLLCLPTRRRAGGGDLRPQQSYPRNSEVLIVSPWKYGRLLKALNLDHSQIVEAALIRAEAIGRAKPHAEVAVKDQAECVSTVIASHGFTMRQTSFLALHLRSPFPR